MTDLGGAVVLGVYQALANGVTLAPVYSVPPEGTLPPVAILAETTIEDHSTKDQVLEQHSVQVLSIVQGSSRAALFALMRQVKDALHDQPIAAPGAGLSPPRFQHASEVIEPDGETMIGTSHFLVFAWPQ